MKKIHIIGLIIIAVSIGAIFTSLTETSTYATFSEASASPDKEFHVVGTLDRSKEVVYNPQENANVFTFFMTDSKGSQRKVILHKSKPQDFDRSEQIVIIGKTEGGNTFRAKDILLKCPSKYNDGKPEDKTKKV